MEFKMGVKALDTLKIAVNLAIRSSRRLITVLTVATLWVQVEARAATQDRSALVARNLAQHSRSSG